MGIAAPNSKETRARIRGARAPRRSLSWKGARVVRLSMTSVVAIDVDKSPERGAPGQPRASKPLSERRPACARSPSGCERAEPRALSWAAPKRPARAARHAGAGQRVVPPGLLL